MRRPISIVGFAASVVVGGSGCGDPGYGDVRGRVTIGGQPLPAGLVVFTNEDDTRMASGYLLGDGTYTVRQAPAGRARVVIQNEEFKDMLDEKTARALQKKGIPINLPDPKEKGTKYVPIPGRYADRSTSGLEFEVKKDEPNEIHIELKP